MVTRTRTSRPDVDEVRHGFNLTVAREGDSEGAARIFDRLTERDALARLVRFKDELGLGAERLYLAIDDAGDSQYGSWESSPLSRVHRISIYAEAHEGEPEEKVMHTLAHELAHMFLYAHGFGWVHSLVPAEVEGSSKETLAYLDQLIGRAEESLAVQLTEMLWRQLLT